MLTKFLWHMRRGGNCGVSHSGFQQGAALFDRDGQRKCMWESRGPSLKGGLDEHAGELDAQQGLESPGCSEAGLPR